MKEALSGKFPFAKEVLERLDGKVVEKSEVKTQGEQRVYVCPPPRVIGAVTDKDRRALDPGGDDATEE
jgi:hypothetical protein